jgi:hypothetical protein
VTCRRNPNAPHAPSLAHLTPVHQRTVPMCRGDVTGMEIGWRSRSGNTFRPGLLFGGHKAHRLSRSSRCFCYQRRRRRPVRHRDPPSQAFAASVANMQVTDFGPAQAWPAADHRGKSGRWRSGATAVLCYGPASWLKASSLTLRRLAVTVKLTNTHLAAEASILRAVGSA